MHSKLHIYQDLTGLDVSFIKVHECPLCKTANGVGERLPINAYRFGSYYIKLPDDGINLVKCNECGLQYKDTVPSHQSLAHLFRSSAKSVWVDKQIPFTMELGYLTDYLADSDGSLIDIGSSDGALLRAIKGCCDVRSALDVYEDPRCQESVSGEYILGFIEDAKITFARNYGVATAFDVFEHFYSPDMAALNFKKMLLPKVGVIFGETGNTDSVQSVSSWWYTHLIEHHIFWNKKSLEYYCKKHGFILELVRNVAHKGRRYLSLPKRITAFILHIGRKTYLAKVAWKILKIDSSMVGNPYVRDHFIFTIRSN